MIFGYIFKNCTQPFEAANISPDFILCRPWIKHNRCPKFLDDISCALAMYSYM